ncbi:cytochrome P450 [Kitasatospora sp. NPDC059571]|uniref:cytochrome P450 n=1 Tax=Kitasatospora sp. NPDC059571 TaxID=3346871 RepID=UPI00367F91C3
MSTESAPQTALRGYPLPREDALRPPDYAGLLGGCPVAPVALPSGDEGLLVTRYEDVRTALAHPAYSRAATVLPEAPKLTAVPFEAGGLFTLDPPEHTRLRSLVTRAFTPRRVEGLRPWIRRTAEALADAMAAGPSPADFNEAFAFPFPVAVICELLGVPFADRDRFRAWSDALLSLDELPAEEVRRSRGELFGYLTALVAEERREPGDGLIGALVRARDEHGALSEPELLTLVTTLLVAGHETTVGALGTAVFTLLRRPGAWADLRREPDRLPAAVEELLRLNPVGDGGPLRVTVADTELSGRPVPRNSAVIAAICPANRDPEVFEDPDAYRPERYRPGAGTPGHLSFGHGPHYCVGAGLARAELEIGLDVLLRRFPGLRLAADPGAVRMRTGLIVNRLAGLPVAW